MYRRIVTVIASLLLLSGLAACGDDSEDPAVSGEESTQESTAEETPAESTTTEPVDLGAEAAYAERGPNEVGTSTFELDGGRRVVVWYPATAAAADLPKQTFDIAGELSPELQATIGPEFRPIHEIDAHPDAEPAAEGPYPVMLFSHGFAGFPEQSADLTTHLASWGFVVIAPEHVERSLGGVLGISAQGVPEMSDPDVLSAALDAAAADESLAAMLDLDRVAVGGHSAGAGATYRTASSDPRMKAFIAYSIGSGNSSGAEAPPVPEIPGMVMAGTTDGVIEFSASEAVFEGMNTPKYLVAIENAGHSVFSDLCLIGKDQGGLAGLIVAAGLDLPEQFSRLASDGCEADDLDPTKAFPAIDHLSVAFLRSVFGIDAEPVGLDPAVTESFTDATVTLTVDAG